MLKKFLIKETFFVFSILVSGFSSYGQAQTLADFCFNSFYDKGECPQEYCRLSCVGGSSILDCTDVCNPKLCFEFEVEGCPQEYCQLLLGCEGQEVCYSKTYDEDLACGEEAYVGSLNCCDDLVKRCGIEFFDGTCDMISKNTSYNVPMCVPCGDGICGQFENRCNCPADCGLPNTNQEF